MKIKSGFVTRRIGDKIVGIAVGKRTAEFNGMITINETGEYIWKCLEIETTTEQIVSKLMKEYSIDETTALSAVNSFVNKLKEYNLLDY